MTFGKAAFMGIVFTGFTTTAATYEIWPAGKMPLVATNAPTAEAIAPTRDDSVRFSGIPVPTVTHVPATSEDPVPAVIICPGGAYKQVCFTHEGSEISQWLKDFGVSAFILKYRIPDQPDAALCDLQRAISYIRANAVRFNVDPSRLGVIGFSAGANLAARAAANHAKRAYEIIDETDKCSCRPDFQMIIYPWWICKGDRDSRNGTGRSLAVRDEWFPIDATTPPAFIVQSEDDGCGVENSLALYHALFRAGVKAEMHLFDKGGHGYGKRLRGNPTDVWPVMAESWLVRTLELPLP